MFPCTNNPLANYFKQTLKFFSQQNASSKQLGNLIIKAELIQFKFDQKKKLGLKIRLTF